jgi:hypothetical protein
MFLEVVWSALPEGRWESARTLEETSGVDEGTLRRVVEFLVRWDFAEVQRSPELRVKRKTGVISPVEVLGLLRSVTASKTGLRMSNGRVRLAERVSCRICAGRRFRGVGKNQVECLRCHETQWYAIDIGPRTAISEDKPTVERVGWLKRLRPFINQ